MNFITPTAQENRYTFAHYFGKDGIRRQDGEIESKNRDFAEEGGFLCPSGMQAESRLYL